MFDTLSSFVEWANVIMSKKNITQADIARTGFVSSSAVSLLFSMRVKSVGIEMCKAISAGLGVPLVIVFEKAGILPSYAGELSLSKRKLLDLIEESDDETIDLIITMLEASWERKKRKLNA